MRKIHYLIMLCLPLCLSIQAKAEPEGMLPAEKAEMKAGKKKEALDLNENQYKKLCRLFKKTEKAMLKARSAERMPAMAGPGGMMPPGMPGKPSEKEMKIIRKETGKIKKILSEEQFIKWRESLHESRKK